MMGNQGSPNPSFFYYDDFTPFVVMACFASLRGAVHVRFFLRVSSAHKDFVFDDGRLRIYYDALAPLAREARTKTLLSSTTDDCAHSYYDALEREAHT